MAQGTFNTEEIAQHASLTRQRAADLQQAIGNLRAAAGQLAAVWTGPGAAAFQSSRDQWEKATIPLQTALDTMGQTLTQASTAYEQNENDITRAFGS
jgi:WXG100 family type VII secretion target